MIMRSELFARYANETMKLTKAEVMAAVSPPSAHPPGPVLNLTTAGCAWSGQLWKMGGGEGGLKVS